MTKKLIIILSLTSLLLVGIVYWFVSPSNSSGISESEAIEAVQTKYPDFLDYPSGNLPPRSIQTEKSDDGWYIAFIQEGSGRPIISATCFFVDSQKNISNKKTFTPTTKTDIIVEFSPQSCSVVLN